MCSIDGIQIDAFDAAQTQDSATRLTCLYIPQFTCFPLYSILLLTLNVRTNGRNGKRERIVTHNSGQKKYKLWLQICMNNCGLSFEMIEKCIGSFNVIFITQKNSRRKCSSNIDVDKIGEDFKG